MLLSHLAPSISLPPLLPQVVDVPNPSKTSGAIDWAGLANGDAWVALITFLYLDFLDATGTLFTMARLINENVPGESCLL
jgi:AGZA family xanthine/uracil permease-like MFS transporter